jgi:ATP-dependent Clp protease ATP-binding subunit ClpB
MNLNRYTEKAQEAVLAAQRLAEEAGHPEIVPEHLLLALITQADGIVPAVLGKMNVNAGELGASVKALVDKLPRVQGGATPGISSRLRAVFRAAEGEAERLKDEFTSTEHVFLALAGESVRGLGADLLKKQGVTKDAILKALTQVRGSQRVTDQTPDGKYQALERSRHRARRRDPPRRSGPGAPHKKQPGAHRRAGRRQDRDCRGPGAADRAR